MKTAIQRIYHVTVSVIVYGLILMMLATLVFAFIDVLATLIRLIPSLPNVRLDDVEFRDLVVSVLDVLVVIELFSTFVNYIETQRMRLSMLIDATAVFILRDMLIKIYGKTISKSSEELLVLGILLVIMVVARSITGRYPPVTTQNP